MRSQCHAHSNFLRALAHRVTHYAIDAHGCEHDCKHGENPNQRGRKSSWRDGIREQPVHSHHVRYWQIRIRFVNHLCDRSRQRHRIGSRPHYHIRGPPSHEVNVKSWLTIQPKLMHVSRDANDGAPTRFWIERAEIDALPERVAFGPETPFHRLVDHRPRHFPIVLGKESPLAQGNSHGRKIAKTHGSELHNRPRSCVRDGLALDHKSRRLAKLAAQGQIVDACRFLHPRKSADALHDLLELQGLLLSNLDPLFLRKLLGLCKGQRRLFHLHRQDMVHAETRIHFQ